MIRILHGDCRDVLKTLPDASVQCCVTSPPYYGLRDYGVAGQIGLEQSPDAYVAEMVAVFREVRRVLRDDGTLWLNLGDSYAADKQLLGVPWRVAFALQADGWWLRSDCIWHKTSIMPEGGGVQDRPYRDHEYLFLLAKVPQYFFDQKAVLEGDHVVTRKATKGGHKLDRSGTHRPGGIAAGFTRDITTVGRTIRTVWTISRSNYKGAHFATMPPELAERCVQAGSRTGDTVLDPFGGAGTTGLVADRLGRDAILIELNPTYADLARNRISDDAGMFASVA